MSDPGSELDPDIDNLLASERGAAPAAPDGSRDRVRRRLAATLGIALVAAPALTAAGSSTLTAIGKWLAVGALGGLVVGGAWVATRPAPTSTSLTRAVGRPGAPPVAAPASAAATAPGSAAATAVVIAPAIAPAIAPGTAAAPAPASTPAPAAAPAPATTPASASALASSERAGKGGPGSAGTSDLEAERQLLDGARDAINRGDAAAALAATRQHERRFPTGQLVEVREMVALRALVTAGQTAQAAARAAAFRRRFPASPYLPAVNSLLGPLR